MFTRKLEEVGRVLFLISLTQKIPTAHKQSHVSMLQEDLLRLPSFPRSAIDAEFSLFSDPQGTAGGKPFLHTFVSCLCLGLTTGHQWFSNLSIHPSQLEAISNSECWCPSSSCQFQGGSQTHMSNTLPKAAGAAGAAGAAFPSTGFAEQCW